MKLWRGSALSLVVGFGVAMMLTSVRGQQATPPAKDAVAEADDKILAEIHDHNEIMSNLEYLSDVIGARLTGTENLKKANDSTRQKFADYGAANPHLDPWTVAHTWTRLSATAQIISPSVHPLTIASYAWAPSTNAAVRGHIVYVKARSVEDLAQVMAAWAYNVAQLPDLLPRKPAPASTATAGN